MRLKFAFGLSCALLSLVGRTAGAQESSPPPTDLPNPYRTVQSWKLQLPDATKIGFTNGVDIAPSGNIMIMTQCGATDCASEVDASGRVLKSFGAGGMFVEPHGLFVDKSGNVWVTDVAVVAREGQTKDPTKGFQVFKFSPDGKVLLTLGQAGIAGEGQNSFSAPSDVAIAPNGDIFVADGHGGCCPHVQRIVKFTQDGKFIKAWGKSGAAPGDFRVSPHALMFDSRGRLFVGDTGNKRIQIFTQDGEFIAEWRQFGTPNGLFIDQNDTLYVADAESKGIRIGSALTGQVTYFVPAADPGGAPTGVEGIVVDLNGNMYSVGSGPKDVKKYTKQ